VNGVPEFTELKNWLPDNADINPVVYSVWGIATDVYRHKLSDIDQLKCVLIDRWA